jgi:hypothetical protein
VSYLRCGTFARFGQNAEITVCKFTRTAMIAFKTIPPLGHIIKQLFNVGVGRPVAVAWPAAREESGSCMLKTQRKNDASVAPQRPARVKLDAERIGRVPGPGALM